MEFRDAFAVLQFVVQVLMGVGLAWVGTKTRRMERLEQQLEQRVDQVVEARMQLKVAALETPIQVLTAELRRINDRLDRGDAVFDRMGQQDHQRELQTQQKIAELQRWMGDNFASKRDLQELSRRFDGLQQAVVRAMGHRDHEAK